MSAPATNIDLAKVKQMIEACNQGSLHVVQQLMKENPIYACQQDETTGRSPLMAAAAEGEAKLLWCPHPDCLESLDQFQDPVHSLIFEFGIYFLC